MSNQIIIITSMQCYFRQIHVFFINQFFFTLMKRILGRLLGLIALLCHDRTALL